MFYLSTYIAVGSIVLFFPLQIVLVAAGVPWGSFGSVSAIDISVQNFFIFLVVSSVSNVVLRLKLNGLFPGQLSRAPPLKLLKDELVFAFAYMLFYSSVTWSFFRGMAAQIFNVPIVFGATNADKLSERSLLETVREIFGTNPRGQFAAALGVLVFAKKDFIGGKTEPVLNQRLDPKLFPQPGHHGLAKSPGRAGRVGGQGGQKPLKFQERLFVKHHVVDVPDG
jgi:hypothetical protein